MCVTKLFDKCMNCYSHEGEFNINGNIITIFRRCSYEDFDNGKEPVWIEGDEAVGVFVNQEVFFGWYEQEYQDLYYAMKDVLEWLIDNKNFTVTLETTVENYDFYNLSKKDRKEILINKIADAFGIDKSQIKNLKIQYDTYCDTAICKIINFNDFHMILTILEEDSETKIADSDPNKETLKNMFTYRYDIL